MRIGHGYDVHALSEGRRLFLGGVDIPHVRGLLGHSDADVLAHAIMDSLLGAAALGDIGAHFPPSDEQWRGACSMDLLSIVGGILREHNFTVSNIDSTIVAEAPKLAGFIAQMRENIAKALGIDVGLVSVKATTEERLGFTGARLGIAAHAVCLIRQI